MYMLDAAAQDFKRSVKTEQKQRKNHINCERGRRLLLKAVLFCRPSARVCGVCGVCGARCCWL
jgi:hypothetical protein